MDNVFMSSELNEWYQAIDLQCFKQDLLETKKQIKLKLKTLDRLSKKYADLQIIRFDHFANIDWVRDKFCSKQIINECNNFVIHETHFRKENNAFYAAGYLYPFLRTSKFKQMNLFYSEPIFIGEFLAPEYKLIINKSAINDLKNAGCNDKLIKTFEKMFKKQLTDTKERK